jgi:hypothetical protein
MDSYSVRYEFSQDFRAPARDAYEWCLDYRPDDWGRMGKRGTRRIRRLNADTLILTDTVFGKHGAVTKRRLVRMDPIRLAWTNTHVSGPNLHSQFWYQIVERAGGTSRLAFTGLQVNYGKRPSDSAVAKMASELRADDSQMWRLLAKEMARDLGTS